MKKVGVFLLFVLSLYVVSAQTNSSQEGVDLAYQCLKDLVDDKQTSELSLQEAVFSTLALGSQTKLKDKIEDERNGNCWPDSTCNIKETSQVLLAYERINKDTDNIEKYLLSKNGSASELSWFLLIDITNHIPSSCTIRQGSSTNNINIREDMKITGSPGSCLTIESDGYWLEIRNSCFNQEFQVSCDEDFVTTLLYQKSGSETVYVSSETHSAASSGTTTEKINAQCFKQGSSCDYEGTLWAALALDKAGVDVTPFVPYLLALAGENERYLPSSFLYLLTNGEDQYSNLVQAQKQGQFWQAPNTKYNKFYDTALAMAALQSTSSAELESAKSYLLDVQTPEGCWNNNNLRDTAFILYAGWSRGVVADSGAGGSIESCEGAGFFCSSLLSCVDSGGSLLDNYQCNGFGQRCCSTAPALSSCVAQQGIVCPSGQQCSGTSTPSLDGQCCLGSCQAVPQENLCESAGGICSFSCNPDTEEQASYSCGFADEICCIPRESGKSSNAWIWIILLLILIALVVLAIIYRKKLQTWWFQFKNRKKSKPSPSNPRPTLTRPVPAYSPRPQPRQAPSRRPSKSDSEMDEVLKKLKEMSK